MDESAIDYVLDYEGTNYTYCAHESNNSLVSISEANQGCPTPFVPLRMTCNFADALSQAADTPYSQVAGEEVPDEYKDMTLLEAFGFGTVDTFRAHLQAEAPTYDEQNSGYFGCH